MNKESIHAKGFNISDSYAEYNLNRRDEISEFLDYGKIKVGTKTLTDAVLDLGSLQKSFPRHQYTNKAFI